MFNKRIVFFLVALIAPIPTFAQNASDFGSVGLIDMPSARMRADGTFNATLSRQDLVDTYNLTYQSFPWLETTFRYAIFDAREDFERSQFNLRDRSYGVKLLLLGEGKYRPAVAIGSRDILGTGVFGSEYIVANKKLRQFDFTLGIGWGRLSGNETFSNPFTALSDSFENRDADVGQGGEFSFSNYFSGEKVGVFGGIKYSLPKYKIDLLAEYNSDNYSREAATGIFELDSRYSFGLNWQALDNVELGLSWQHGSELGIRLSSNLESIYKAASYKPRLQWGHFLSKDEWGIYQNAKGSNDNTTVSYERLDDYNDQAWMSKISGKAQQLKLPLVSIKVIDDEHLAIEYYNTNFTLQMDAVSLLYQQAVLDLPQHIKTVSLINVESSLRTFKITLPINRNLLERSVNLSEARIDNANKLKSPEKAFPFRIPFVRWSADFGTRLSLFAPEAPLRAQLNFKLNAEVVLSQSVSLHASYLQDVTNNFSQSQRQSDSVLPRVRSDINRYLEDGASGIDQLYLEKYGQLSPNLFYRSYAGILEEMFSGVGTEVLYRPFNSRFAYGLNVNYAVQRDFQKNFAHQNYDVVTGHASIYWASPFYNYDVALHVGRYLAKDIGATLEVTRTFANGWEIGLFATLTDVPFEDFGEGSFDKGLKVTIPFNLFGNHTRKKTGTTIRSIQRDGGARLDSQGTRLWSKLRSTHKDRLTSTLSRLNKN